MGGGGRGLLRWGLGDGELAGRGEECDESGGSNF